MSRMFAMMPPSMTISAGRSPSGVMTRWLRSRVIPEPGEEIGGYAFAVVGRGTQVVDRRDLIHQDFLRFFDRAVGEGCFRAREAHDRGCHAADRDAWCVGPHTRNDDLRDDQRSERAD